MLISLIILISFHATQEDLQERLVVGIGDNTNVKVPSVQAYQPGSDERSSDAITRLAMQLLWSWNCQ